MPVDNSKLVPGSGPLTSPILVIGEAPGEEEVMAGRPFVGSSGKFLREKLTICGVDPDLVRYENLMERRPEGNKFALFVQSPEGLQEVRDRASKLAAFIREVKPNLVLCLGAQPLYFMMGNKKDVSAWRGNVVWSENLGCKVMCTYHPSACLRQRNVDKLQHPGQFEVLFEIDVKRAVEESRFHEYHIPRHELCLSPSFAVACNDLDSLMSSKVLSLDIETSNLCMTCIGFAGTTDKATCIPFLMSDSEGKLKEYWENESERATIFRKVAALLESQIPKVTQNGQYDVTVLQDTYGIKVQNLFWDTLVAAHNLYCHLPKDLGTLVSLYTRMPFHKIIAAGSGNLGYWKYNALDALTTLMIYEAQYKEMQDMGNLWHYRTVTQPLIPVLIQMQMEGIKVDLETRDKAIVKEKAYQQAIHTAFTELVPGFNFSGSSPAGRRLLYDTLGCRVIYKDGEVTLNADALKRIKARDKRKAVQVFCEAIIEYRQSAHMTGVLETPLKNGRINTAYDASGTDTGRLNSKESIFGTGTNLQNLSKGIQRKMLIPG